MNSIFYAMNRLFMQENISKIKIRLHCDNEENYSIIQWSSQRVGLKIQFLDIQRKVQEKNVRLVTKKNNKIKFTP